MKKGLIGKKLGMPQIFADDGRRIPVTVIQAGPCVVTQKKTIGKDGYDALQIGFDEVDPARMARPALGHVKAAGKGGFRTLRELRFDSVDTFNVGDVVGADQFVEGEYVDVVGTSKGKGFQGVVKRWGFKGGRASHGSRFHRAPGSIGASAYPSRVFKNMGMPGQMGNEQVTIQRLQVVRVDVQRNLLLIKGAVPGAKNGVVLIKDSVKAVK
jgi:large subunit ribosomal protein L3